MPRMRCMLYSSCASSTWSLPAAECACRAKMSRITRVRSTTRMPSSSSSTRCWLGESSSSVTTTSASCSLASSFSSLSLPLPTYVRGWIVARCCTQVATMSTCAVRSSSRISASSRSSSAPCASTATSTARSGRASYSIILESSPTAGAYGGALWEARLLGGARSRGFGRRQLQQRVELPALLAVERAEHLVLGGRERALGLHEQAGPALGQLDQVAAAVRARPAACDQPLRLELIQQPDEVRAVDLERRASAACVLPPWSRSTVSAIRWRARRPSGAIAASERTRMCRAR